jgi:hypothetical protein
MSIFDDPKPATPTTPAATNSAAPATPEKPVVAPIPIPKSIFDDPVPQPGLVQGLWDNYGKPGLKLAARTGIHVAAAPFDLAVAGSEALGGLAKRVGVPLAPEPTLLDNNGQPLTGPGAPPRPLPSQELINNAGVQIDPNAGTAMKVADYVLPFLASGGRNAVSRIAEAPGVVNKTAEGLGYLTGGLADAGLSYEGGQLGEQYIGGPEGAFVGSLFGGGVRPAVQRGFGYGAQKTVADPDAPQIFDAMINEAGPNTMPTFGQVSGQSGKQFEKAVGSVPILRSGVNAARENAEEGIRQSVATGVGEVGDRTPNLAPVDSATTAQRIIDLSRTVNESEGQRVADQQQALEDAIGANTPVDVSPVTQTMTQLASAPTTGPANTRALNPRIADLNELIQRQNPVGPDQTMPYPPTAAYGGVKDLRSDLGQRSNSADPLQGYYLDTARDAYTGAMRDAANQAGQGPAFDQANLDYSTFKQTNQPWLERQGGSLDAGAAPPNPTTVANRATAITGAAPGYLNDIRTQLGLDPARATLADVLSRLGQIKGDFTPSRWGSDYAAVNPVVKQFIAEHAPTATPYLENAATGGRAFDLQPERPGLSNSLGFLGGLGEFLSKSPALAVAGAGGLETPSVIRALAGRTDIPALLAQYAQRQGVAAGQRGVGP